MAIMMKLNDNDWNFINDLIFKIHSIPDLDEMRYTFLDLIRLLIPCDKLTFFLSTPEHYMHSAIQIGLSDERMRAYEKELCNQDYKKWIFMTGQNKAYRMTDFFAPGVRESQDYYKTAYLPFGIHYEAILSLAYNGHFVGVVSLYRPRTMTDFTDREIYILEILKKHLAFRLYRELPEENKSQTGRQSRQLEVLYSKYCLTPREAEVLRLMTEGKKTSEICEKLCISSSTLKKHANNIYKKMNVNSRIELINLVSRI